ncbi:4-hydroxythreonine-4-phosphate dehydrogenase PdxA [bacterium]|nr:4-hydroxythreonine-4-phosphate dehydrogenase PdxA [bacterium]
MPTTKSIRVAITSGDPAGVGPEIVLNLLREMGGERRAEYSEVIPFIVGEARLLEQVGRGLPEFAMPRIEVLSDVPDRAMDPGAVPVLEPEDFRFEGELVQGRVLAQCGAAAWAYIRRAVALIQSGRADAVVTAPLHKEALQAAGCPHPGHTEMLADLAGGADVAMLLVGGGLRVALATIHVALSRVPGLLTREGILQKLELLDSFIPCFGLQAREGKTPARPRIGVTGLNPHAGEGGLFGSEERDLIEPAIVVARSRGIDAHGPLPADTIFHFHREGAFDAVLAMYHDQALIPVKTLAFHDGVNVTMGLPFIRTSPDHGTAFDIAGKGFARPDSLRAALDCAVTLVRNRRR